VVGLRKDMETFTEDAFEFRDVRIVGGDNKLELGSWVG
jgi:hypothetical protein